MATYQYGTSIKANSYNFYFRSFFTYATSEDAQYYYITLTAGVDTNPHTDSSSGTVGDIGWNNIKVTISGTGQTTKSETKNYRSSNAKSTGELTYISSFKWKWAKGTSSAKKTITAKMTCSNLSTSTATKEFTVPALKSFKITYNGNGGTAKAGTRAIPETITYYYGKDTFSTNGLPDYTGGTWDLERTDYKATGYWFNSSNTSKQIDQTTKYATTQALYKAATGNSWDGTSNATNFTLKAGWELDYILPKINSFSAIRVNSNTNSSESTDGQYVYFTVNYTHGKKGSTVQKLYIKITQVSPTSSVILAETELGNSSTSPYTLNTGNLSTPKTFSTESAFTFKVELYNKEGDTSTGTDRTHVIANSSISTAIYPMDLLATQSGQVYMGVMTKAVTGVPLTLQSFNTIGDIILVIDDTTGSGIDYDLRTALSKLGWNNSTNGVIVT